MIYRALLTEIHSKSLKLRRLDALVESFEFKDYWERNTNRQDEMVKLIDELAISQLRELVLGGHDIENMTVRELRNLAIKWHMKYYTKLPKDNLRAELMRTRDEKK